MEKCVFIGYPQGYKGWKFYNPTTKKTVISERANFDERHFPLSKRPTEPSIPVPITTTYSLPFPNHPTPSLPAPRTPKAPYYVPPASDHSNSENESNSEASDSEADDESSSDESMDHGGSNWPPVPSVIPSSTPTTLSYWHWCQTP
ncbi:hypothetical protein AZE42_13176 [Rhizopogon vesiculosus]|uniref:Retroviral polymerase SH3-like domain-containing protein n=1 Tax=Rhizopogon vesiculosus TaxID=180088 RepID=A0A1J8QV74_9AGAM|nr:hypothetical protein AZE42_13176 [Rhizopogon vesiculosus]